MKSKNRDKINLSVFFPAYNEEKNIIKLIKKTSKILPEICDKYEIIVVNDGSQDKTKDVVENFMKKNKYIRLINHKTNKGYGAALKSGFYNSKYEWIFFTDGDGQFDISEIKKLIELSKDCDIVVGYRIKRKDPLFRKVNAFLWGFLVKTLFNFKVKDVDCAFKLIKKEVIDKIKLESDGAMISTELIAKANKLGYRIKETGVHHYPRKEGKPTGANIKVILKAFKELFKLYKKIK